jgi:hypothetical protein
MQINFIFIRQTHHCATPVVSLQLLVTIFSN